mgnify:CR=1 FL=1
MPALLVSKSPPLSGEVTIHGAKNSVLPILAATLLCRTPCVLHNCPDILDVTHTRAILHSLGCASERRGASVYIDPRGCAGHSVPPELAASMRASSLFLGALLARQGEASLSLPGGCPIGARPVDYHLLAFRALGAEGTVLILGCTSPQRAGELARLGLTQTVADLAHAEALNAQGVPLRVHLKVDTGMHRLGIAWDAPEAASAVFRMENLTVDGIYSHLCCADSLAPGDVSFTREQIRRFYALTAALAAQGISLPKLHLQSSYGLLNYPELRCDYARVGLALYGAAEGTAARSLGLRPVLSLRARVASVRDVAKGESVGYDRAFTARRKSRIAVLPIG